MVNMNLESDPLFTDSAAFAQACIDAEKKMMDPRKAIAMVALDYVNTTGDERRFIRDLVMKPVPEQRTASFAEFVTPDSIRNFRSPEMKYALDFSSARSKPQDLFASYFDGTAGVFKGKKTKKSEVARFGHLEKSAAENFSKVFSPHDNERFATFEFMAICCLYFQVEAIYAVTLFHKCTNMGELMSYRYLGGALWLFLENEIYDYERYVRICCQALKADHNVLPDYISRSRYWKEVYAAI